MYKLKAATCGNLKNNSYHEVECGCEDSKQPRNKRLIHIVLYVCCTLTYTFNLMVTIVL